MKLALGTVQFGMKYGITNHAEKVSEDELKAILDYAKKHDIRVIDTAPAYGDSEEVLGSNNLAGLEIITKVSKIGKLIISREEIERAEAIFFTSLKKLRTNSVKGLLLHDTSDLSKINGDLLYEMMQKLKERNYVRQIGVSVYTAQEIEQLYNDKYQFDLIQIPINVFDQRLDNSIILPELKKRNIKVFARSVFLQGILLEDKLKLPVDDLKSQQLANGYFNDMKKLGLSKIEAALLYIQQIKEVDYVLIGVQSLQQLIEINKAFQKNLTSRIAVDFKKYIIENEEIIDPRKW